MAKMDLKIEIEIGSWWASKNTPDVQYFVICITNRDASDHDKYPITVVYGDNLGRTWSKSLSRFIKKMDFVAKGVIG